jgi:hypothetical protein
MRFTNDEAPDAVRAVAATQTVAPGAGTAWVMAKPRPSTSRRSGAFTSQVRCDSVLAPQPECIDNLMLVDDLFVSQTVDDDALKRH